MQDHTKFGKNLQFYYKHIISYAQLLSNGVLNSFLKEQTNS